MRFGLLLVGGSIFLLILGGQGLYEAAASNSRQARQISYQDFVRQRPGIGWYKITGVDWSLIDAVYMREKKEGEADSEGKIGDTIYLPVHDATLGEDAAAKEKVVIVLETSRPEIHSAVVDLSTASNEDQALQVMKNHKDVAFFQGPIEGTVKFGMDADSDTREKLAKLPDTNLDTNYVILKDGAKPNGWAALGEFLGGIVVGILAAFYWMSRLRR